MMMPNIEDGIEVHRSVRRPSHSADDIMTVLQADVEDLQADLEPPEEGTPFLGDKVLDGSSANNGLTKARATSDDIGIVRICGIRTRPSHRAFLLAIVILSCILAFVAEYGQYLPNGTRTSVGRTTGEGAREGDGSSIDGTFFNQAGGHLVNNATRKEVQPSPPPPPPPQPDEDEQPQAAPQEEVQPPAPSPPVEEADPSPPQAEPEPVVEEPKQEEQKKEEAVSPAVEEAAQPKPEPEPQPVAEEAKQEQKENEVAPPAPDEEAVPTAAAELEPEVVLEQPKQKEVLPPVEGEEAIRAPAAEPEPEVVVVEEPKEEEQKKEKVPPAVEQEASLASAAESEAVVVAEPSKEKQKGEETAPPAVAEKGAAAPSELPKEEEVAPPVVEQEEAAAAVVPPPAGAKPETAAAAPAETPKEEEQKGEGVASPVEEEEIAVASPAEAAAAPVEEVKKGEQESQVIPPEQPVKEEEGPADTYSWSGDYDAFLAKITEGKKAVEAAQRGLWEKHAPHSEDFFSQTVGMFNEAPLTARFVEAIVKQAPFIIGVMGTSVTAGHDNKFVESYPVVWGDRMHDAFAAMGVELIVTNSGMGWNPIFPSYYCVSEVIGDDVDISVWEFGMMGGLPGDMEHWVRNSLSLSKQPHLLILDPGINPRDGATERRTDPKPGPWKTAPMDWYSSEGFSVASNRMEHAWWHLDQFEAYNYATVMRKDKTTTRPASWHPGPHGHALRADILAYNYLGYFLTAIDQVINHVSEKKTHFHDILPIHVPLPEPKQCQKEICETAPKCVTSFLPRVGESLKDYVTYPEEFPMVTDSDIAANNKQKGWHEQLYFCDVGGVNYMLEMGMNFLDRKIVLQGTVGDGPMRVEFESKTDNYVIICSAPGNVHLCASSVWKFDGEVVECYDKEKAIAAGQPATGESCFITAKEIPAGKHTFELEMVNPINDHDMFIPFTHLVWW